MAAAVAQRDVALDNAAAAALVVPAAAAAPGELSPQEEAYRDAVAAAAAADAAVAELQAQINLDIEQVEGGVGGRGGGIRGRGRGSRGRGRVGGPPDAAELPAAAAPPVRGRGRGRAAAAPPVRGRGRGRAAAAADAASDAAELPAAPRGRGGRGRAGRPRAAGARPFKPGPYGCSKCRFAKKGCKGGCIPWAESGTNGYTTGANGEVLNNKYNADGTPVAVGAN